ncbi:MAG: hypothetical protein WC608_04740 [Parcubacteria group bacterium]
MIKTKTKTLVAAGLVAVAAGSTVFGLYYYGSRIPIELFWGKANRTGQNAAPAATLPATTAAVCGNGKLETSEECDDGNKVSGDGCSGCPIGCQTSFNSINSIFNISTASAVSCTGAFEGCPTSDQWSCISGTCQKARCGDGVCNDCSNAFSPCFPEADSTCPGDCKITPPTTPPTNPPTTPPTPTTGECKACAGGCKKETAKTGVDAPGTKELELHDINGTSPWFQTPGGGATPMRISALATHYWKFTIPADLGDYASVQIVLGSHDYTTQQDLVISLGRQFTDADYADLIQSASTTLLFKSGPEIWYSIRTNQVRYTNHSRTIACVSPGQTVYILVKNVSNMTGYYVVSGHISLFSNSTIYGGKKCSEFPHIPF